MEEEKEYFQLLEDEIANLEPELQGRLFRPCGINCVSKYVLPVYQQRVEECNHDMNLLFSNYPDNEYSFSRVIEKDHIYEMGYPRCLCYMHQKGFTKNPVHCECSRQSIIYTLNTLFPDKKLKVQTIETILNGDACCKFRIVVEK